MNFFELFLFLFPDIKAMLKILSLLGARYQFLWKLFLKSPELFSQTLGKLGIAGRKELSLLLSKAQKELFLTKQVKEKTTELKEFTKLSSSMKGLRLKRALRKTLIEKSLPFVKKIPKRYDKITPEAFKPIAKKWNELVDRIKAPSDLNGDFALLSSSWLLSGSFNPDPSGQAGELTITTKQGRSYPYPGVSTRTWEAMKKATGSHGTGAGSVFWVMYLHHWRGSATRKWMKARIYQG